jgi:Protein of unknown function (DUF1571)
MRTYLYIPVCFVVLLIICLMFAPVRRVTGDHELIGGPSVEPPAAQKSAVVRSFADLCRDDPVEAIATSMRKYRAEVETYTCKLYLRERIDGKLREPETVECQFRDSPFAVRLHWIAGKSAAETMVYEAGANDGMYLIVPSSDTLKRTMKLLGKSHARRKLDGPEAKANSRYAPNDFGIYKGTARTYDAWHAAQERGALRTEYLGLQPIPELNGKLCHSIRRTCLTPEEDGMNRLTIHFDPDTLLQVGAELMIDDEIIGRYYFLDVKLNVPLDKDHFAAARVK